MFKKYPKITIFEGGDSSKQCLRQHVTLKCCINMSNLMLCTLAKFEVQTFCRSEVIKKFVQGGPQPPRPVKG